MKKSNNFVVPMVVYPFYVIFGINQTDEDFLESIQDRLLIGQLEDLKVNYPGMMYMASRKEQVGKCLHLPGNQILIRIHYKYPESPDCNGTIAHEIFHAVDMILDHIGIKLSKKSDEAYAYAIGYLTTEFYKNYK